MEFSHSFAGSPFVSPFLERFWLERARCATGRASDADALERLRPAVRRLSDQFTTERPAGAFPDYFEDDSLLAAYGLFFFPQSFVRARLALDQPVRFRGWRPHGAAGGGAADGGGTAPLRVLDLGGGAGPCGLAVAAALQEIAPERPVALTVLDHSPAALAAFREIVRAGVRGGGGAAEGGRMVEPPVALGGVANFFRAVSVETVKADLRDGCAAAAALPPQDVIIAGFCVNELVSGGADALARWLGVWRERLAAGGLLLVLEPALRATALRLRGAADALAAAGVFCEWAPGFGGGGDAGGVVGIGVGVGVGKNGGGVDDDDASRAVATDADPRFHPHEVRAWTPPESLAFLNRELFRETGVLKFAYVALGAEPPPALDAPEELLRLVSPLELLKGRIVGAAEMFSGARLTLEIPTRGLSKSEAKRVAAAHARGDILRVSPALLRPVGLASASTFRLDSAAALRVAYAPLV